MADMTQKKKKLSRQTMLVIVFALLVLGGGGYYYYMTFVPKGIESVVELGTKRQLNIKRIDWQRTVYDHATLKQLANPLPSPLQVEPIGNPQPFRIPTALAQPASSSKP